MLRIWYIYVKILQLHDIFFKLTKKIRTSGCAVGTVYGDIMNDFSSINLNTTTKIKTSWIYAISKKVNNRPSLYLKAGALHGCVLCKNDSPLIYVEDVLNVPSKIANWVQIPFQISALLGLQIWAKVSNKLNFLTLVSLILSSLILIFSLISS